MMVLCWQHNKIDTISIHVKTETTSYTYKQQSLPAFEGNYNNIATKQLVELYLF